MTEAERPDREPLRGHHVFDGETRMRMLDPDVQDRVIRPEWFQEQGASYVLLTLRKLELWTLGELSHLRVGDFLQVYGRGSSGLVVLRRAIADANIGSAVIVPRPQPVVLSEDAVNPVFRVRTVPKSEWTIKEALGSETRGKIEELRRTARRGVGPRHQVWPARLARPATGGVSRHGI